MCVLSERFVHGVAHVIQIFERNSDYAKANNHRLKSTANIAHSIAGKRPLKIRIHPQNMIYSDHRSDFHRFDSIVQRSRTNRRHFYSEWHIAATLQQYTYGYNLHANMTECMCDGDGDDETMCKLLLSIVNQPMQMSKM